MLNELYPNDKNGDDNEWFEIYNPSGDTININGWLVYSGTTGDNSDTHIYTFTDTEGDAYYLKITLSAGDHIQETHIVTLYQSTTLKDSCVRAIPDIGVTSSWARYEDPADDLPYDSGQASDWFDDSSPSDGGANELNIPEFNTILLPISGILAMFAIIRRKKLLNEK